MENTSKAVETYLKEIEALTTNEEKKILAEEGLKTYPNDFRLLKKYASIIEKVEADYAFIIARHFEQAYLSNPNDAEVIHKLAYYKSEMSEYDAEEVIRLYEKYIEQPGGHEKGKAYNNLGWQYEKKGDFGKAEEYYLKALELDEDVHYQNRNLARIYINELDRLHDAIPYYEKLVEIENDRQLKDTLYLASLYEDKLKNYERALFYFNKAVDLDDTNGQPHIRLTQFHLRHKNVDKAKYHLAKAKAGRTALLDNITLINLETDIANFKGNKIERVVENSVAKVVEVNKSKLVDFDFLRQQNAIDEAVGQFKSGDFELSKNAFLQLAKTLDKNAVIQYNIAECCMALNQLTEAEDYYKKAIEFNPEYAEAYNSYTKLLMQQSRFEEAEKNYELAKKYWEE